MDVSDVSGKVTILQMLVAMRLAPPVQLIFFIENRRDIVRIALPRREWTGMHQMSGPRETSAR